VKRSKRSWRRNSPNIGGCAEQLPFHVSADGVRRLSKRGVVIAVDRPSGLLHSRRFPPPTGVHGGSHAIEGGAGRGAARRSTARISADHPAGRCTTCPTRLITYQPRPRLPAQQELLARAAGEALRLTTVRYEGGASSYLEVLDADTRLFVAQLGLAQGQLNELLALVQIYRSLGRRLGVMSR